MIAMMKTRADKKILGEEYDEQVFPAMIHRYRVDARGNHHITKRSYLEERKVYYQGKKGEGVVECWPENIVNGEEQATCDSQSKLQIRGRRTAEGDRKNLYDPGELGIPKIVIALMHIGSVKCERYSIHMDQLIPDFDEAAARGKVLISYILDPSDGDYGWEAPGAKTAHGTDWLAEDSADFANLWERPSSVSTEELLLPTLSLDQHYLPRDEEQLSDAEEQLSDPDAVAEEQLSDPDSSETSGETASNSSDSDESPSSSSDDQDQEPPLQTVERLASSAQSEISESESESESDQDQAAGTAVVAEPPVSAFDRVTSTGGRVTRSKQGGYSSGVFR